MSKITLSWVNLSNIHTSQKVYKSLTTFDSDTLPVALATLSKVDRSYVDNDVVAGLSYYYAVSTVSGSGELVSAVKKVDAVSGSGDVYWSSVKTLMHFDGNLNNEAGSVWSAPASTYEAGKFSSAARIAAPMTSTNTVAAKDFTVELIYKGNLSGTAAAFPYIFGFAPASQTWGVGAIVLGTNRSDTGNKVSVYIYGKTTIIADVNINDDVFHTICLCRVGNTLRLFIDGVVVGSSDATSFSVGATTTLIGSGSNYINCLIDEFRITEGVGRYVSDYTPATEPFTNY